MQDSPLFRWVFPIAWLTGCVAAVILIPAVLMHGLNGIYSWLFSSPHRWHVNVSWRQYLILSSITAAALFGNSIWQMRRRSAFCERSRPNS